MQISRKIPSLQVQGRVTEGAAGEVEAAPGINIQGCGVKGAPGLVERPAGVDVCQCSRKRAVVEVINAGAACRGSHTVSNTLTLAATAGSTGIYNLNNSSLTAALTNINTGGTFNQTGGAFNTKTMNIYTGGSFNFTGGAFSYTTLNLQGGNFSGNLQNQGLLSGFGTLTGNITNSGIVSPGNSPGVLNIVGSSPKPRPAPI